MLNLQPMYLVLEFFDLCLFYMENFVQVIDLMGQRGYLSFILILFLSQFLDHL